MRRPIRPAAPPSVADRVALPVPRMAPTIPLTMPLRIRPAPQSGEQAEDHTHPARAPGLGVCRLASSVAIFRAATVTGISLCQSRSLLSYCNEATQHPGPFYADGVLSPSALEYRSCLLPIVRVSLDAPMLFLY